MKLIDSRYFTKHAIPRLTAMIKEYQTGDTDHAMLVGDIHQAISICKTDQSS